jgi:hypothetical protein
VTYTNEIRGALQADGTIKLDYVDRLVWIVRFTGTPQPVYGPRGSNHGPFATELNVVVDAMTGQVLEMFSYR